MTVLHRTPWTIAMPIHFGCAEMPFDHQSGSFLATAFWARFQAAPMVLSTQQASFGTWRRGTGASLLKKFFAQSRYCSVVQTALATRRQSSVMATFASALTCEPRR